MPAITTIAAVVTAAVAVATAAYQIKSGEDAKDDQKKAQAAANAARSQYGIGNNQDPLQQITAKFNAQTQLVDQTANQLATTQKNLEEEKAKEKQILTIALVAGGGLTLFLLLKK